MDLAKRAIRYMNNRVSLRKFSSYDDALRHCGDGYDDQTLVDAIVSKPPADVLPNYYAISLLALQGCGSSPRVLDFGGSTAAAYFASREHGINPIWAVVETEAMVNRCRHLEDGNLAYFTSIESARAWLGGVDIVHASGAIQYTRDPQRTISDLATCNPALMLFMRTAFADRRSIRVQTSTLSTNGGLGIAIRDRAVRYPVTFITEQDFLSSMPLYRIKHRFQDAYYMERALSQLVPVVKSASRCRR